MTDKSEEIAKYKAGTAKAEELEIDVAAVWKEMLSKPDMRAEAADALGISPGQLDQITSPPINISPSNVAGAAGSEIVIWIATWIGSEVMLGALKDLAKEELKKRVKKLWLNVLEPAVRSRLKDFYGLGSRLDPD
jgi:hypothetical protein